MVAGGEDFVSVSEFGNGDLMSPCRVPVSSGRNLPGVEGPGCCSSLSLSTLPNPQSTTNVSAKSPSMTLPGFRSRWITARE